MYGGLDFISTNMPRICVCIFVCVALSLMSLTSGVLFGWRVRVKFFFAFEGVDDCGG